MKLSLNLPRARIAGFTLTEIYIVSVLLLLVVLATTATQFFAARVYTLAATKLTATAAARKALNDIREQIRGGGSVDVGIYDPVAQTFTNMPIGSLQIGNALLIYSNNPNANATPWGTIYYMNPQASNICSIICSNTTALTATLASNIVVYITNYYVFDSEDAFTSILTTYQNNRLIHVKFQFSEWEYPLAGVVGQNAMYDYYQLQTRVAPRIINY
jgi:hypothetical protein